jgi:aminoglycoside phosphotransferase (APT) family kinase protein
VLAGQFRPALDALAAELHGALPGAELSTGWIHGDFWASNLLASADGRRLTGVVDWDRAASGELAIMDVLHLVVQRRKLLARQREPGGAIVALLQGEGWTPFERELLAAPLYRNTLTVLGERGAMLLYWLRMMAIYLEQDNSRAADAAWVLHNIEKVLR